MARFQQLTAPVAAKAVEDTVFYRHGRLLSRNEVGADPARFALSAAAFHRLEEFLARRIEHGAHQRRAVFYQCHGDSEFRQSLQITIGAIDWVDHPYSAAGEPL